ncbi:hypothetical protein Trydic_g4133 [Trypoxylus dichotomus]
MCQQRPQSSTEKGVNIQPLDQNAIRITMLHYRRNLLTQLLAKDTNISASLQNYSLKDAVLNLIMAWNSLKPTVIEKCCVMPTKEDVEERLLDDEIRIAGRMVLNLLQHIEPNIVYEETDVENWNKDVVLNNIEQNEEEFDSESEKEADCMLRTIEQSISTDQALISLNEVIKYIEENNPEIDYSTSLALLNLLQKS